MRSVSFDSAVHNCRLSGLVTFAAVALAIMFGDIGAAFAQASIEEITVSARKREESLQDVPVAIQAYTSSQLDRYSSSDLTEISELATQVILIPAGSGAGASLHIRGLGSSSGDPGIDSSVTINVDGMQVNRGRIVRQAMFDMERVEILKGPQALFFGKNSPAGVISVTSKGPTEEWELMGRVGFEFEADEFFGEAAVSGPISEKVGFRFAFKASDMKGYLKNVAQPTPSPFFVDGYPYDQEPWDFPGTTDPREGSNDQVIGRLTLTVTPNDNFDATLKVLGTMYNDDGANVNENIHCSGPLPISIPVLSITTGVDPNGDCELNGITSNGEQAPEVVAGFDHIEDTNGQSFGHYDSVLTTLDMEYSNDDFTITSITGIYWYDWLRYDNFDGTVFNQLLGIQIEDSTTWSQEFRGLSTFDSPFNFMIGVFYENVTRDSDNAGKIAAHGPDPITGRTNSWSGESTVKGKTYSVFGQIIWDATEDLEIAAGLRWTKEDKSAIQQNVYVHPMMENFFGFIPFILPVGMPLTSTFKDNDISPEASVTWNISDEVTLYGAYKSGYKSGGFSTNTVIVAGATGDGLTFDAESSEGGEIGLKSTLFDGTLRLNVTAYRYEFSDLQVQAFDSATTSFSIRNAAKARTTGVEIDMSWAATAELLIHGQVGFNRARYAQFEGAPVFRGQLPEEGLVTVGPLAGTQDLTGASLNFAPDWNITLGFAYDTPLGNMDGLMLGLSGDLIYMDAYETQLAQAPFSQQDSTVKINASVRLYSDDDSWEFAVIGKNLTNERMIGGSADKPGSLRGDIFAYALRARQIMLQGTIRY